MYIDMDAKFCANSTLIKTILPDRYRELAGRIWNSQYTDEESNVSFSVSSASEVMRFLEWGSNTRFLIALHVVDRYQSCDLQRMHVVEVFCDMKLNYRDVLNIEDAFVCESACSNCRRLVCRQTGSLRAKVAVPRKADFQMTWDRDLLVSGRVQVELQRNGVECRPLVDSKGFFQVLAPSIHQLRLDVFPIKVCEPCPGCGQKQVRRRCHLTGLFGEQFAGISIYHMEPALTLSVPVRNDCLVGMADTLLNGNGVNSPTPIHRRGERVVPGSWSRCEYGFPVYFMRAGLVQRLLEIGATGLDFRPSYIGEAPPDAFRLPY